MYVAESNYLSLDTYSRLKGVGGGGHPSMLCMEGSKLAAARPSSPANLMSVLCAQLKLLFLRSLLVSSCSL